jgi:Ca-activated chloride channel family protein
MKNLKTFSLALAMLISFLTFGQEKTITGVVSDSSEPLPGASVVIKGTTKGVQTNIDEKYSIKAKIGDILIYSFIGYDSKNITVGTANVINVKLSENSKIIEEVVVTSSLGIKREKNTVLKSAKEITINCNNPSVYHNLQNKVSGIQVITNAKGIKINGKKTENYDDESYDNFLENPFESPKTAPLSTFSIDVDNASYTNVRRFINNGQVVPKDAVRVEEMVNFFKYNYPQPLRENPFSINTEYSDCPWNSNNKLVRIGLQGKIIETDNLPASNMVFLIDVSGSMSDINKLPLLKESLKILVKQLRNEDKISMVVYAGAAGLVLPPTSGKDKKTIIDALDKLQSGGSTAGGAGIELAYKVAQENFIKGGNKRVILATDGDFNVGSSSDTDMQTLIEEKRKSGVFLTCLGYGMGNYKDSKLETLADKGNGNYAYIDNIQEANRFLGKEFKDSMFAIAKDVKIQIEFNPKHVQAYRLIGYENRKLRDEDFTNDTIDAGELGSGHTVTALYEIIPRGVKSDLYNEPTDLKYSVMAEPSSKNYSEELATIKFRYKKPDGDKSIEIGAIIANKASNLQSTSEDFKFCASVAWFGLKLRDSKLVVNKSNDAILELANQGLTNDFEGYRAEFIRLIENVRL